VPNFLNDNGVLSCLMWHLFVIYDNTFVFILQ
jgi:hypothetical protein